ncbi:hypothetical protein G9A89_002854 [Geosiphon pyriformis]|nr:hypothetical protein G9A89_002854 [Geosiphon pyriformis]
MTTIKVIYKSIIRRFSLPSNTRWTDLEAKVRELFSIPSTIPIQLSYRDEDGDAITLSTDFELQEILTQQPQGTTFKFILSVLSVDENEENKADEDSWVLESRERAESINTVMSDETASIPEEATGLQIQQEHVIANPENPFLQHSEPQKIQKPIQTSEETVATKEPIIEPQSRSPSYNHTILTDEVNDPISQQNDLEKDKQKEAPGETSNIAASSSTSKTEEQSPIIGFAAKFLNQCQDGLASNPQIFETIHGVMEKIRAVPAELASFRNRFVAEATREGETSDNDFFSWARGRSFPFSFSQEEELTQEALQEKLDLLHQMGYCEDDEQNTNLLNLYNGNLEYVIEVLIEQQEQRVRAPQGQERSSSNNGQEGQETRPYNI